MDSDSTQAYEITFPDGRKMRCSKIGPAEQAAIDTAIRFGERLVVTISPIAASLAACRRASPISPPPAGTLGYGRPRRTHGGHASGGAVFADVRRPRSPAC